LRIAAGAIEKDQRSQQQDKPPVLILIRITPPDRSLRIHSRMYGAQMHHSMPLLASDQKGTTPTSTNVT